ncbi:serine carboxypeptidase-like 17 [Phragmites australis]|uniref:serine carboxypeptidase-like 17 n=1 Tax=Phragmites australis TaxID=29695 RepID=UPI002D785D2D|nr:serine carboxypeptidase-like 17 [Phragmites australis]
MRAIRFPGGELWWWMLVILLLCCRFSSSSLPLIAAATAAAEERVVTHLPGFEGPLPFHLRTGYVEVDEGNGVHLFYYFIPSERSPADDPLMLWLSGGPGCSSLTGLVYQIGPLGFDLHGYMDGLPKLVYRPESWTKLSNIIFLDSPVGAGFSYSITVQGYKSSDTKAVNQILIFLRKWFDKHPEFLSNPLYIGGDSYSGMIVPTVTSGIANGKHVGSEPSLNLKGYLVGNPLTDSSIDGPSKIPFAHRMALISDQIYEVYKKSCSVGDSSYQSVQCTNSLNAIHECVKDIFPFHVLEPLCSYASPHPYNFLKLKLNSGVREMQQLQDNTAEGLHLSEISTQCRTAEYTLSRLWANDATVREALGIHKGTVPAWLRCNTSIPYTKDIQSSVKYHLDVTTKGYRSLVYSGDHDMVVPYIGTQSWIRSLNFSIVDDWRPWYVNGQVAGYTTSYSNNLTFTTVKGAGHTAPEYQPRQCLAMMARWFAGDRL